jgi:hypothetical protein
MFRNSFEKRLRMEMLEPKIPMAADVSISVVNGDLLITGDDNVNHLLIEPHPDFEPGHYVIHNRGVPEDTVNGELFPIVDVGGGPTMAYIVSGVTRDVIVNLNGGDDVVTLLGIFTFDGSEDLLFPRDLIVNMGEGNDQFFPGVTENIIGFQGPVTVNRNFHYNGGGGDDYVMSTALTVGNNFTFTDTQGNNFYEVAPTFIYPVSQRSEVGGNISFTTGSGDDVMVLEEFDVSGNVSFNVGAGDDVAQVRDVTIGGSVTQNLGAGTNNGIVEGATASSIAIGGSGVNFITVQGVTADRITVMTGNNLDNVFMFGVNAGMTTIATFGGDDGVQILDSAFDLLIVELGAGNDAMTLEGVTVDLLALLSGGRGTDSLTGVADNDINILIDLGFEAIAGDLE